MKIQLYSQLLASYPIQWSAWEKDIQQYISLLEQWNKVASLVSETDLRENCIQHIEDSISLIPYIIPSLSNQQSLWLDIGSGSGFPAIPILFAQRELNAVLLERKTKKAGFLQMLISRFQLKNTKVICNAFPDCVHELNPLIAKIRVITSRGIENPERLAKFVSRWLPHNIKYLCQSPKIIQIFPDEHFIKTTIYDDFTQQNLRRGTLTIIHRKTNTSPST